MEGKGNKGTTTESVDFFRDTPIRYLGYANEIGEAFKSHIPRLLYYGSYTVSSTYCLADAISKGFAVYKDVTVPEHRKAKQATLTAVEAAVWQGLASVIIPGFTINRICFVSRCALQRLAPKSVPLRVQGFLTTAIGLTAIPIIIKPIDRFVDNIMAYTWKCLHIDDS